MEERTEFDEMLLIHLESLKEIQVLKMKKCLETENLMKNLIDAALERLLDRVADTLENVQAFSPKEISISILLAELVPEEHLSNSGLISAFVSTLIDSWRTISSRVDGPKVVSPLTWDEPNRTAGVFGCTVYLG